ncbi:MAG TPA: 1-phosphofructokinase family hexose kinase [bacterium]|nr:1-phosphofructokinase family hexose kinase [bacterium]
MKKIVTFTLNPAIDKSSSVENVVAERKLYCKTPRFEPGGGGVNVSRAIRKLGGESTLLYPAGGLTGDRLEELLDREGLTHRPIPVNGVTRESLVVLEESTGRQFRFNMPGPELSSAECDRSLDIVTEACRSCDYLVVSGSLPEDVPAGFYAKAVRTGKENGVKVIVDTSGEALKQALDEGVYMIKPNIREFRNLVGEDIREEAQIRHEARKIIKSGRCQILLISLGSAGALLVSEEVDRHIRPPTVPIVSKVGAGDSMVAGVVLSLARDKTIRESVLFGVAAGAAAVMTLGTELCRREDTERLYQRLIEENPSC